ncbi:MAG: HAD hydrolase family protein [Bdellovibrionaceae bacterium]|nr:HAD hydrolase family protein [Bdellovibrio sp.]
MGIDINKLNPIKMLVLDVDGVLTDCRLWMDSNGEWKRFFSIRDGVGIKALIEAGYKLAIITGTKASDIRARAKVLGINYFYEGASDKWPSFEQLQKESGISPSEMAYVGDDVFDIRILQSVAFGATVPEAVDEVLEVASYVTKRAGGNGAVREICDFILKYGHYAKN